MTGQLNIKIITNQIKIRIMYANNILNQNLFGDIQNIAKVDQNKYDPLFLTSNLFGLVAYTTLNKVFLTINKKEETTTNCAIVNVGKSGSGKTTSGNLVLKALKDIEQRNFDFNEKVKKFCAVCKEYAGEPQLVITDVMQGNNEDDSREEFVNSYYEKHFADDPWVERGDIYFTTNPADLYKPQYVATVFTEEGLRKGFKNSLNNTLLLNSPEMEHLFENLARTSVANNAHTTLIDLIDGFKGVKMMVGGNDYQIGRSVVITSTIHSKIEKYKKIFFDQTTAYRTFFVIGENSQTDYAQSRIGQFDSEGDLYHVNVFKERLQKITELLLSEFDKEREPLHIDIDTPEIFELIKSELLKIRQDYFKEEKIEYVNKDYIEGISNRLEFKLLQTILILHLLNTSYSYIVEPTELLRTKLSRINEETIMQGVNCFRYFLTNMFSLLESDVKTDLNETQQYIVDTIKEGDQMGYNEWMVKVTSTGFRSKNGAFKKVSDKTVRNFLNDEKSKPFIEIVQLRNGNKLIKRKVRA